MYILKFVLQSYLSKSRFKYKDNVLFSFVTINTCFNLFCITKLQYKNQIYNEGKSVFLWPIFEKKLNRKIKMVQFFSRMKSDIFFENLTILRRCISLASDYFSYPFFFCILRHIIAFPQPFFLEIINISCIRDKSVSSRLQTIGLTIHVCIISYSWSFIDLNGKESITNDVLIRSSQIRLTIFWSIQNGWARKSHSFFFKSMLYLFSQNFFLNWFIISSALLINYSYQLSYYLSFWL